jgi:plastocyanin
LIEKSVGLLALVAISAVLIPGRAFAQQTTVTASVAVTRPGKSRSRDASNVVLWLTPTGATTIAAVPVPESSSKPRLVQKNKSFEPHVLVVPVGSLVQFPNRDPFFHNVFSLFEGKRFDLGLYEAGSTRDVLFDKPGISYIFCNIHAEMSAVVVAVNTPYFGVSDRRGQVLIRNVLPGSYLLRVWYESALPDTLNALAREVTISDSASTLGRLTVPATTLPQEHKNLYGRDYTPPSPTSPTYEHP